MVGAIAALALATLTANAGTTANSRASGSLVSLVAAIRPITKTADRNVVTVATRSVNTEKIAEPADKPIVAVDPIVAVSPTAPRAPKTRAACQHAINTLKSMHQADVTEDAAERAATAQQPL